MPNIEKQEIKCPKASEHPHKKILMLIGKSDISVYCRDHGWIKVELHKAGKRLNFENVSAKITGYPRKTNFICQPTPGVALGEFKHRKKYAI